MLPICRNELSEWRMACFEMPKEYMTESRTFLPPEWMTQWLMSLRLRRCCSRRRWTIPGIFKPIR